MKCSMLLFSLFAALAADAASLDTVVTANYPNDLTAAAAAHHYDEQREQAYVALTNGGAEYVVAAYTNGQIGAISLIEKTADGYRVDQELSRASGQMIGGKNPEVSTLDVDGDGVPELIVRFIVGMRNSGESWVLRLAGSHLQVINPTSKRGSSLLGYGDFVDLNGNGILDIIDDVALSEGTKLVPVHQHYVLRDGSYVLGEPLDYHEVFYREDGAPRIITRKFSATPDSLPKPTRLVIVNGDTLGKPCRVSSGRVTLNGVTLSPPQDFSMERGTWSVPVTLQQQNTLTIWLDGKPSSRVAVVVRHD